MKNILWFILLNFQVVIFATAYPEANDKVIYIYRTDGCQVETPSGSITLQSADAREKTIEEINNRVDRLLHNKYPVKLAEGRNDTPKVAVESRYLSSIQFEVTKIPEGITENEMIALSSDLPCVEEVARDGIKTADSLPGEQLRHAQAQPAEGEPRSLGLTPSDPYLTKQWALLTENHWGIRAQAAWAESTGHEFIVAVIDSGCDLHHPEIQGKLWVNKGELDCYNGIDDDGNGYIDDCYGWDWVDNDNNPSPRASGHGTGAAGIIASATNNAVGIAGICWFCKIMCLRFISGTEGKISNQVAAIDYAIKNGARISNNSYGGYGYSALEYRAIERGKLYGHLFVASAGNNNLNTDDKANDHTPSVYNLDNILAVGASTQHGGKAAFSNFGQTSVDVFAPGSSIQTVADGGRYAVVSGTSFAAPMAAGTAALVWSEYPSLSYKEVRDAVVTTCKSSPRLARKAACPGVLDAEAAMEYAYKINMPQQGEKQQSDHTKESVAHISLSPVNGAVDTQSYDWYPGAHDAGNTGTHQSYNAAGGNVRQEPHAATTNPQYFHNPFPIQTPNPYEEFVPMYSSTPYGLGLFSRLFSMTAGDGEMTYIEGSKANEAYKPSQQGQTVVLSYPKRIFGGGLMSAGAEGIAQTIETLSGNKGGLLGSLAKTAGIPSQRYLVENDPSHQTEPEYEYETVNDGNGYTNNVDDGYTNNVDDGYTNNVDDGLVGGGDALRHVPQAARQAVEGILTLGTGRQSSSQIGSMLNGIMSGVTNTVGGARQRFG